jgi:hypothetical protein
MNAFDSNSYSETIAEKSLRLLGLDNQTAPTLWFVLGCSIVIAIMMILTYGNVLAAYGPLIVLALMLLTWYRIDYSLFALIGCVLLFDQYAIPGFDTLTHKIDYFKNLKEISYLPSVSAGVMNPIEVHLLCILLFWFFNLCISKQFSFSRIPVWGALFLLFGWLSVAFAYGLSNGAELLTAIWEVRALFYFLLFYIAIPQVVRTKRQLNILLWIIIGAITVKAFQGIGRFVSLGLSFQGRAALTSHEDPVFMTTLFILLFGLLLYGVRNKQRTVLLWLFLPLLIGFFTAQRRAALAGLLISLGALFMMLPGPKQWKLLKVGVPIVLILLLYGAAMWDSNSKWAKPVQMIKSGLAESKEELSPSDYYSNLYREYENYNLAYTSRNKPVVGTGFGIKYEQPFGLANISFPLKDYIPHNQIFWVIVKAGSIGFFLFWFFFNAFAFQGVYVLRTLNSPYLKAICIMIVVAIANQMTVSYFDLQLTYYRNMIYLGTLLGLLPVLQNIDLQQIPKPDNRSESLNDKALLSGERKRDGQF